MRKVVNKNKKRAVCWVFLIYLMFLGYHLFLSDTLGRREVSDSYRYNFTLFKEISRYITNIEVIGAKLFFFNIVGNVLAFVPFGIFVNYFFNNRQYSFIKSVFLGLMLTTLIEGIQLVTKVGSCDVDDIFLNFIGVVIGAIIAKIFYRRRNGVESETK